MGISDGLTIFNNLLENRITSNALTTLLSSQGYLSGLQQILNSRDKVRQLIQNSTAFALLANSTGAVSSFAESEIATKELIKNSNALYTLITTDTLFDAYKNNVNSWAMLDSFVNRYDSKLIKEDFLANGTFSLPAQGIKAYSLVGIGCGGESGGTGGGSGAEIAVSVITSSLPTTDLSIVVGSGRLTVVSPYISNSTIIQDQSGNTLLTAVGGRNLLAGTSVGGGTNSGGNLSNGNLISSPWQFATCTKKGGDGGFGNGVAGSIGSGGFGSAGSAETVSQCAGPGVGFGNGGGGTFSGGVALIDNVGSQAAANSGCGSGASDGIYAGGTGRVIIHAILK